MKPGYLVAFLCVLGLLANALVYGPSLRLTLDGVTDFISFYTGGRLIGTPDLYNPARMLEVQNQTAGWSSANRPFSRLPYFATLMWPLTRLAYLHAYYVWQTLSIGAAVLFAWLWPATGRRLAAIACCWSLPLFSAFAQGQDIAFVLAAIGGTLWFMRKGSPFAAGLVLALCAAKFHIFLLVPLWIAAQRLWQLGKGFSTGAAVLVAISFAAGGRAWPVRYFALLCDPGTSPAALAMPNLRGFFWAFQYNGVLEVAAAVCVGLLALWSFRRLSFEYGLAMTIAAGILISHHSYVSDCALLVPASLSVLSTGKSFPERFLAVVLLVPLTYIGTVAGPVMMLLTRAALLSFVGVLAWAAWRFPQRASGRCQPPARPC